MSALSFVQIPTPPRNPGLLPVILEGTVQIFTTNIPGDVLADFRDYNQKKLFLYTWVDSERGHSAQAMFEGSEGRGGTVRCEHQLRQSGDPDLLKAQVGIHSTDPASGNRRTVTFCTGCVQMDELLKGGVVNSKMTDQFKPNNFALVQLRMVNASDYSNYEGDGLGRDGAVSKPFIQLAPSSLWSIEACNDIVDRISNQIANNVHVNGIRIPPGGEMFTDGQSSWEMGGGTFVVKGQEVVIPPLLTHYALMDLHENLVERQYPVALGVYSTYLRLHHTGKTMNEILGLPDEQFAPIFMSGFGMNNDSGITIYQRDFTYSTGISFISGLMLSEETNENMAVPLSAPQSQGRRMNRPKPIIPRVGSSMAQLAAHMCSRPLQAIHEDLQGVDPRQPAVLLDDCESLAFLGKLNMLSTIRVMARDPGLSHKLEGLRRFGIQRRVLGEAFGEQRGGAFLRRQLDHWPLFKSWTDSDMELMARYMHRGIGLLGSGRLQFCTAAGIAKSAALGGEQAAARYNGHCHNIGLLKREGGEPMPFLLEGTAPMYQILLTDATPTMTVKVRTDTTYEPRVVDMGRFLSMLGQTFSALTQVIDSPNGGKAQGGGWPLPEPLTGWISSTMVLPALQSNQKFELNFYNRVMYAGLVCTPQGAGCMPVEEHLDGIVERVAGCHPYQLGDLELRGVSACVTEEERQLLRRVMNEAHPPTVPESQLLQLAENWVACGPLSEMNAHARSMQKQGVQYLFASFMETPCCADYVPVIYEAKRALIERMNQINLAREDSDGIYGEVVMLGTGVHGKLFVPQRAGAEGNTTHLTVVQSLLQSMKEVEWPALSKVDFHI